MRILYAPFSYASFIVIMIKVMIKVMIMGAGPGPRPVPALDHDLDQNETFGQAIRFEWFWKMSMAKCLL